MNKKLGIYLLPISLMACSEGTTELVVSFPDTAKQEVKELVTTSWPRVLEACPGLNKYSSSLTFDGVDDNFEYAPEKAQRADVKFLISEDGGNIPKIYRAFGHRCQFGITRDGAEVMMTKGPCKSICLDEDMGHHNGTLRLSLAPKS